MKLQQLEIAQEIYQEYTTLKCFQTLNSQYLNPLYLAEVKSQIAELQYLLYSEIDYCITDNQLYQDLTHSFKKN